MDQIVQNKLTVVSFKIVRNDDGIFVLVKDFSLVEELSTAIKAFEGLRFGIIGVNDVNPTAASAPFGGMGDSGLGREGGHEGIAEYLETKLGGFAV